MGAPAKRLAETAVATLRSASFAAFGLQRFSIFSAPSMPVQSQALNE
jgi:hypothetical protein